MKKIIYVCFLSIVLAFVSCNNEDSIINQSNSADKVQSGKPTSDMLHFNSTEELKSFILERADSDLLEEAEIEANRGSRTSLLYLYSLNLAELDSKNIDRSTVAIVNSYDDMLHYILNKDGEIGIADFVFRINGDFVFKYKKGYSDEINRFMKDYSRGGIKIKKGEAIEYNESLTVFMHESNESIQADLAETILYKGSRGEKTEDRYVKGTKSYTYFSSGKTRMRAKIHQTTWFFYTSIGASTKTQIRKRYWFFGWHYYWKTKKAYNRFNYEGTRTITTAWTPPTTITFSGHEYCYCRCAYKTFSYEINFGKIYRVTTSGKTHHWSHWFSETPDTVSKTLYF